MRALRQQGSTRAQAGRAARTRRRRLWCAVDVDVHHLAPASAPAQTQRTAGRHVRHDPSAHGPSALRMHYRHCHYHYHQRTHPLSSHHHGRGNDSRESRLKQFAVSRGFSSLLRCLHDIILRSCRRPRACAVHQRRGARGGTCRARQPDRAGGGRRRATAPELHSGRGAPPAGRPRRGGSGAAGVPAGECHGRRPQVLVLAPFVRAARGIATSSFWRLESSDCNVV
jgi:hypothetical protein